MIKTVSFAPPRGSKSASTSGSSTRSQTSRRTVSAPAAPVAAQPAPARNPTKTGTIKVTPAPKSGASKGASAKASSKPAPAVAPASPFVSPATGAAPQPTVSAAQARAALQKASPHPQTGVQAVKPRAPRTRKAAIPENLAEQYGAKVSRRVEAGQIEVPAVDAPKKRLTKAEREARKQLLRPDEDLMARLQSATPVVTAKKVAKPRGWRFECGRCGRVLHFQTPGALCECGAIAVKD